MICPEWTVDRMRFSLDGLPKKKSHYIGKYGNGEKIIGLGPEVISVSKLGGFPGNLMEQIDNGWLHAQFQPTVKEMLSHGS